MMNTAKSFKNLYPSCRRAQKLIQPPQKCHISVTEMFQNFAVRQFANGASERHVKETAAKLNTLAQDLALKKLSDVTQEKTEKWIAEQRRIGSRAPRTINSYIIALKSFCNYLVETGRLPEPPLRAIRKLNEAVGKRKQRRSFTADELRKLYETTRRQQEERLTNRHGKPQDDRELIYRLLAGTGLRSTELGLAAPFQFDFERNLYLVVADKTKNKKTDTLPIRADLMQRLKKYITDKNIDTADRIFHYSVHTLLYALKQDLKTAGIEQKTADGRSLDVHSFRRTFGTMLARAGVPLTTTQRLMRHSSPVLTAKLYIDIDALDMHNALEKLAEM